MRKRTLILFCLMIISLTSIITISHAWFSLNDILVDSNYETGSTSLSTEFYYLNTLDNNWSKCGSEITIDSFDFSLKNNERQIISFLLQVKNVSKESGIFKLAIGDNGKTSLIDIYAYNILKVSFEGNIELGASSIDFNTIPKPIIDNFDDFRLDKYQNILKQEDSLEPNSIAYYYVSLSYNYNKIKEIATFFANNNDTLILDLRFDTFLR